MPIREFPLSLNARGAEIKDLHTNLARLGLVLPKNELDEQSFGVATRDAILKLQVKYRLARTGVLDEATKAILLRAVAAESAKPHVEGRILLDHGQPGAGVTVRLYNRGFGGAGVKLGESKTDSDGFYAIAYELPRGVAANLEVRAFDSRTKGEVQLSGIKHNAQKFEVLNLVAPATLQPLAPEFTRLTADLVKHVGRLEDLANAREDSDHQDLMLLHKATGWDARLVAMAAIAVKLRGETSIPQDALYALFRAGLPTDKSQLARVSSIAVEKALSKATDAGIIKLTAEQLSQAKARFEKFARETRLTTRAAGTLSSIGEMLKVSGLSGRELGDFEELYSSNRGDPEELWKRARELGISESRIKSLRLQGKLAYLTLNNGQLTTKLQGDIGTREDLSRLVDLDLYTSQSWKQRLTEAAGGTDPVKLNKIIPPAFPGDEADLRLEAYAADLARQVRLAFPTRVVSRMIENNELRLGANHDSLKGPVRSFLQNAQRLDAGFELGRVPLAAFIRQHQADLLQGIAPTLVNATLASIKRLQRLYQITPTDEALVAALDIGFTSANEVAAIPHEAFIERFGDRFTSLDVARLFYSKAQQVSAVTYNVFTSAKQLDSAPTLFGLSPSSARREQARNELIKHYPTMEAMFGSLDFCECDHCGSVLSPAAYLVDLLEFLDPRDPAWSGFKELWKKRHIGEEYTAKYKKPYDALIGRRPDLPHIPLTCENTNTAMPYIDLVNEILEYYVANDRLDEEAANDTGDATTSELLAEPQNVIGEAYARLLDAHYPIILPFDLWLETVRRFCDYFETPLSSVLEAFRAGDALIAPTQAYDRESVFAESLGLSPAEYALFTDTNPLATWHVLYGYETASEATTVASDADTGQRIDLNSAKALSRRLGVTYKELVEVVRAGFVNPKLETLVVLNKLGVTISDVLFYRDHRGLLDQDEATLSAVDHERWLEVQEFEKRLNDLSEAFQSTGFNASNWLNDQLQNNSFDDILVLSDPSTGSNFDETTLRYASGLAADGFAFLKINLLVRLWRKLGWTIEETDRALQVFVPRDTPFDIPHLASMPLRTALLYLAHLKALEARVRAGKQSRLKLLTMWSPIATTGRNPLYGQLFLTRGVLKTDPIFDHPLGQYLSASGVLLKDHLPGLQAALGLTAGEVSEILTDAGLESATAALSLSSVSLLYRHNLLAKALKLSIRELVSLKQISGLDPFKALNASPVASLEEDNPFAQTLRFVDVVKVVKESGLRIDDLDYLLRHQFDPVGGHRMDAEESLKFISRLSAGVRAIRAEYVVPRASDAFGEDVLRQKLGLALAPDAVERLISMINGTAEFTVTKMGVPPAEQLLPPMFADEPPIAQVAYNETRNEQKLTVRGALFDDEKSDLMARFPLTHFAELLNAAQAEARSFFDNHLRKQMVKETDDAGFLDTGDFETLFRPLQRIAESDSAEQIEQKRGANEQTLSDRRARVSQAFYPVLQRRLIRQFVVEAIKAHTGADEALVEALVTDARLLGNPQSMLEVLSATSERGINAAFFSSTDGSGNPLATITFADVETEQISQPPRPAGSNSVRFDGFFEVPVAGAYRFYVVLDKAGAEAELRLDHQTTPLLKGAATANGAEISEYVDLRSGVPYHFSLDVRNLGDRGARMLVQSEAMPKGSLERLSLSPQSTIEAAERALVLLGKALKLIETLNLSIREVSYLFTHAADFGNVNLSELPSQMGAETQEGARTLFEQFMRLAGYARLKREMAGGTDDLISVFEADSPDELYSLIATITRRDKTTIQATAEALFAAPVLKDELTLERLWRALEVVERFGVAPGSIAAWTKIVSSTATPSERHTIARSVKEAIKSHFEPDAWQRIAQSIFDKLRQQQRDALVAHVLHRLDFARVEQLYEYFLIDPGMEPVAQTSRIRLAISSAQLFIQRCLLNLERSVHPSAINSKHWQWMKRYRVWEASRKIFLFPENWLEPEFRDDKSHLFLELESSLLQTDVSNDLAEDAFFQYLRKLEEIARLEMVAMYLEERLNDPEDSVLHVIGRTTKLPRNHFYRRYQHRAWTPWEPVPSEIEGDHVVVVMWQGRLNLFWATFFQKGKQDLQSDEPVSATLTKSVSKAVKQEVEVQLNRCELFQGEWTKRESSGFDSPIRLSVANDFKTSNVLIHVSREHDDDVESVKIHLRFRNATESLSLVAPNGIASNASHLSSGSEAQSLTSISPNASIDFLSAFDHQTSAVILGFGLQGASQDPAALVPTTRKAFHLGNRNSPVTIVSGDERSATPLLFDNDRINQLEASGALRVSLVDRIEDGKSGSKVTKVILERGENYTLLPCSNSSELIPGELGALATPFFYQDHRHTFLVEPTLTESTIREWNGWAIGVSTFVDEDDPPQQLQLSQQVPVSQAALTSSLGEIDPHARFALRRPQDWLTDKETHLQFGERLVGKAGALDLATATGLSGTLTDK